METQSYRTAVKCFNEDVWLFNGLRFPTEEDAKQYGMTLAQSWKSVEQWKVVPSYLPPNVQSA